MAKKRVLGRGLSALLDNTEPLEKKVTSKIEEETVGHVAGQIAMLKIGQIEANPMQPRTHFDEDGLSELAQSIVEMGIIQPITVRKVSTNKYQLISGERRFRASQIAGLEEIPSYIRTANDQELLEMALVENIQRENLDPMEIAISYQRLIDECDLTQEGLSERVGKNRSTVTNYLRLLKLPGEVQVGLIEKKISMGHARALVNAGDEKNQIRLFRNILSQGLSVRKVEELVRDKGNKSTNANVKAPLSFEEQKWQADLRIKFGKGASIKKNSDGRGKIEIKFGSDGDLKRILDMLESLED